MEENIFNIEDRHADLKQIDKQCWRAEHGIRAICLMYDDHSSDKQSKKNIFILKDNVHYRLFSLKHQYLIYLRELSYAEKYLQELHQNDPRILGGFPIVNPYFEKVELELSSVFDNIVFQLSSVFDYMSHLTCYICQKNKSSTLYWTKLVKAAYGKNNDFSDLKIKKTITNIDSNFAGRLYDYRSRLLHNKKDKHIFNATVGMNDFKFELNIIASDLSIRHFKAIREEYPGGQITLTFLASWLIKRSFVEIEKILDALREEILKNSCFYKNLRKPKIDNSFMLITMDPKTKYAIPMSDGLWKQYKEMK